MRAGTIRLLKNAQSALLACLVLTAFAGSSEAQWFSAELLIKSGNTQYSGNIYVSGSKLRVDVLVPNTAYSIWLTPKGTYISTNHEANADTNADNQMVANDLELLGFRPSLSQVPQPFASNIDLISDQQTMTGTTFHSVKSKIWELPHMKNDRFAGDC